jgi:hypothetical protein
MSYLVALAVGRCATELRLRRGAATVNSSDVLAAVRLLLPRELS